MVRLICSALLCIFLISCSTMYYKFDIKAGGSLPIDAPFTLNREMTIDDLAKIDTSKYYVETVYYMYNKEYRNARPTTLKFSKFGFISTYIKTNAFETKQSNIKMRFLLENDKLSIEGFYPAKGGKTKLYSKNINYGYVNGDTIVINWSKDVSTFYVKSNIIGSVVKPR